jgi:DNA-binding transcriptional MerR regulator
MQDSFTSREIIRLTGITARQLQWWDERGLVVPAREGHRRVYTFEDLTEVAVICELRRKGFSLQRMRQVVRFFQQAPGRDGQRHVQLSPADRWPRAVSRDLAAADCRHLEELSSADVCYLPE